MPEQNPLPSVWDWLPERHLAYFVSQLNDQLDLLEFTTVYGDEERATPRITR